MMNWAPAASLRLRSVACLRSWPGSEYDAPRCRQPTHLQPRQPAKLVSWHSHLGSSPDDLPFESARHRIRRKDRVLYGGIHRDNRNSERFRFEEFATGGQGGVKSSCEAWRGDSFGAITVRSGTRLPPSTTCLRRCDSAVASFSYAERNANRLVELDCILCWH